MHLTEEEEGQSQSGHGTTGVFDGGMLVLITDFLAVQKRREEGLLQELTVQEGLSYTQFSHQLTDLLYTRVQEIQVESF